MEEQKLTTEELYGKSDPPSAPGSATAQPAQASEPTKPLIYEETPIIEPASPAGGPVVPAPPPKQPKNSGGFLRTIGTVLLFVILFGVGVWLSTILGPYVPATVPAEPTSTASPEGDGSLTVAPTGTNSQSGSWVEYTISGASLKLPAEVLAPVCDGANCISQGTYLPGGTRFTMATHNNAQILQNAQVAVIVDSNGRKFTTTPTTVAGHKAFAFEGLFSGTTTGGYGFSQMRGVMIVLDDTKTLELNHFTPSGVSADFVSDDRIFDDIVKSLSFTVKADGKSCDPASDACNPESCDYDLSQCNQPRQ